MEKKNLSRYATVRVKDVKPGTRLITDDGFTCMGNQVLRIVKAHTYGKTKGELYVSCSHGSHYLDGQLSSSGKRYVGFWLISK